jgi:uncharacterized membrane protein
MDGYKTLIGALVAAAAQVLALAGIQIEDVAGVTNAVVTLVGLGIVVYGRLKARTPGPLAKQPEN